MSGDFKFFASFFGAIAASKFLNMPALCLFLFVLLPIATLIYFNFLKKPDEDREETVLDKIDAWHESNSNLQLHEYLGWTREEYKAYVERGTIPTPRPKERHPSH